MLLLTILSILSAPFMNCAYERDTVSLNGTWNIVTDILDKGEYMRFFDDARPEGKEDFVEYSFSDSPTLQVPGDWNSQSLEWKYYEGTIWYGRHFDAHIIKGYRQFIYFAGVSYRCKVYLNGNLIARHEGSFVPFEAEVTDYLHEGDNFLCVMVNNKRMEDGIPAMDFDWWNYGGITRDVFLVRTPEVFIRDWSFTLAKDADKTVAASVTLSDPVVRNVRIDIPELGIARNVRTDSYGHAEFRITSERMEYWNPGNPKLYKVSLSTKEDRVSDLIGFRKIETIGTEIFINGKKFFARSVCMHEEIPQRQGRAYSKEDAEYLVSEAGKLGANMIRLAHYPQNEHIVRLAEKKGIVLWEEIPLWQKIKFSDEGTYRKAEKMYTDMLFRDRNRCCVCFWGLANETRPGNDRNAFLERLLNAAKKVDDTRLYTIADDNAQYNPATGVVELTDPMFDKVDVVAINKYYGWYHKWPVEPQSMQWNIAPDKPLIVSEFGGESMKGIYGNADVASSWSEDYQLALYKANIAAFRNIGNLAGISPWVLFDFRSPRRFLHGKQDYWNRKGLISDKGEYKKVWFYMRDLFAGESLP